MSSFPQTSAAFKRLRAAIAAYRQARREEKAAGLVMRAFRIDPTLPDMIVKAAREAADGVRK